MTLAISGRFNALGTQSPYGMALPSRASAMSSHTVERGLLKKR